MTIDKEKLKYYAELLESEIDRYKDESKDARFLAEYDGLQEDIADAKAGRIITPRWDHGLGYWIAEQSQIDANEELSQTLAIFRLLLRGRKLPNCQVPSDYSVV